MRPKDLVLKARNTALAGESIFQLQSTMHGCVYGCSERMGISVVRDEAEGLVCSRKQCAALN